MDEYISRHEAIRAVQLSYGNYEATRKAIFELPAADVAPVVHCHECKHHVAGYCCRYINGRTNMFRMFDNDFCSYGERKTDEQ